MRPLGHLRRLSGIFGKRAQRATAASAVTRQRSKPKTEQSQPPTIGKLCRLCRAHRRPPPPWSTGSQSTRGPSTPSVASTRRDCRPRNSLDRDWVPRRPERSRCTASTTRRVLSYCRCRCRVTRARPWRLVVAVDERESRECVHTCRSIDPRSSYRLQEKGKQKDREREKEGIHSSGLQ